MNKILLISAALIILAGGMYAKPKHTQEPPRDQIAVVAHLALPPGGSVTRFLQTQHYRRDYLYAEREAGNAVTLIDVTQAAKPSILADVAAGKEHLVAVAGDAALVSSAPNLAPAAPQTFRIMNFTDPLHPAVQQEFQGVTAICRDEKRGLIFLANANGIWVLQERLAMDPEFEKEWEHMALDAR
jgi:hypothetical protein